MQKPQDLPEAGGSELEKLTLVIGLSRFDAPSAGPPDGEPVLLLHGWPEFVSSWTEELKAIGSGGYHAIAVDQRGYSPGARPTEVGQYAPEHLVADGLGFADSQGAGRFHLIAHDWGGMVAWALASAHPDRLLSLAVLATPHPIALRQAAGADQAQYHRLDYVRFFRQARRRRRDSATRQRWSAAARRLRRPRAGGNGER